MEIKAIQTKYKGYRFRSRLEARFAVFLDELKVDFQYEHEGFEVAPGDYYLPDFYLPASDLYVEIKPSTTSDDEMDKAMDKMILLATKTDTNGCIVTDGNRNMEWGFWQIPHATFKSPKCVDTIESLKAISNGVRVHSLPLYLPDQSGNLWTPIAAHFKKLCTQECALPNILVIPRIAETDTFIATSDDDDWMLDGLDLRRYLLAEQAAKSARFEHGEKGHRVIR
jgi:hypothetical protein